MTSFPSNGDPGSGGIRKSSPCYSPDRKTFPKATRLADPFMRSLVEIVGEKLATPSAIIYGPSRSRIASLARYVVCAIAALGAYPALNFSEIGRYLKRDHTTIIHGLSRIAALAARSEALCELIDSACRDAANAGWPVQPVSALLVERDVRLSGRQA